MEERLVRHHRNELDYLRQFGAEFAEAHQDIARELGVPYQTGMDPHVERLRESFALIAARINAKIEDEQPEITEALLGILCGAALRPVPSMSIVRFDPAADKVSALIMGSDIEAGAVLKSDRTESEPSCEFRTAYPVKLWPLQIETAILSPQVKPGGFSRPLPEAMLNVPIRCLGPSTLGQLSAKSFDSLRFYLGGEERSAYALRDRLIHDVVRIELREHPARPDSATVVLARTPTEVRRAIRPVGFAKDEGLLPNAGEITIGSRNLREFFIFPAKYRFFEVGGLGKVRHWTKATGFDIRIYFSRSPDSAVVLRGDSLQLYCTPIVNLFTQTWKIDRDGTRVEYEVEPPSARRKSHRNYFEVFSIDSVRSEQGGEYPRYDDLRHRSKRSERIFWYCRRRPTYWKDSKRTHVLISFVDESRDVGPPEDSTIRVHATCTNLDLPAGLPLNSLRLNHTALISGLKALEAMTPPIPPPTAREFHWRLIAQTALNHLPVGDPPTLPGQPRASGRGTEVLREILRLHDPARNDDNLKQINAIKSVESKHEFRALPDDPRAVVGGIRTTIDFGEDAFSRHGLLLGEVIDHFLGNYVSINSYTRLIATSGRQTVKQWEPRAGEKILV